MEFSFNELFEILNNELVKPKYTLKFDNSTFNKQSPAFKTMHWDFFDVEINKDSDYIFVVEKGENDETFIIKEIKKS